MLIKRNFLALVVMGMTFEKNIKEFGPFIQNLKKKYNLGNVQISGKLCSATQVRRVVGIDHMVTYNRCFMNLSVQ